MDQEYLCTMLLLLVRLATKLNLDQDPADLGFDPTECEHRRRLYWHIITLYIRTAEACGTSPLIVSQHVRTKIPSTVPDPTLELEEAFDSPEHDPNTFYATMGFEMAKIARQVLFSLVPADEQGVPRNEIQQLNLSDQLHQALLSQYGRTCDCIDSPLCRFTIQWCSIYWTRLKLLVVHSNKLFLRQVSDNSVFDPEKDLLACIGILERVDRLRADIEYSRWAWLWQNCVEWDASAIALCMIATGKCTLEVVSRAWIALDTFFQTNSGSVDFGDPGKIPLGANAGFYRSYLLSLAHRKRWRELVAFRDWVRDANSTASSSISREVSMSDEG